MKTTNSTESNTTRQLEHGLRSGEQSSGPKKLLLTREMAAERLGCHWQTVIYREKCGDLTGIKIGRRKFYSLEEVERLIRYKPVRSKPHWTRRPVNVISFPKPTLWQRIKSLFV